MKVKQDFVTNSSSTSFCGFGSTFELSELKEMIAEVKDMDEEKDDIFEEISTVLGKYGLTIMSNYDNIYVGATFADAKMTESKQDIKNKVENAFLSLGIEGSVDFMEEAWRDG